MKGLRLSENPHLLGGFSFIYVLAAQASRKKSHRWASAFINALLLTMLGLGDGISSLGENHAIAQVITSDGTTNTVVNPVRYRGTNLYQIVGGTVKGDNLFHSFDTFSPGEIYTLFDLRSSQYSSVDSIFSRITGSEQTFINGPLQVVGGNSPDLFLLNPNGISMGPTARLYLPGSFFGTTAEQISFSDGVTFSSTDTSTQPLLTISAPAGLQFGADAAPIQWTGSRSVSPLRSGENFTLLGGDIEVDNVVLLARSGQLQLASVGAGSQIPIDAEQHKLTYSAETEFGDINISRSDLNASAVQDRASYTGGSGEILLRGQSIDISSSRILSFNTGSEDGGNIDIRATEGVAVADTQILTTLYPSSDPAPGETPPFTLHPSTGTGGSIHIEAESLVLQPTDELGNRSRATRISADTYSTGDGGLVSINAGTVSLLGSEQRLGSGSGVESVRITSDSFNLGNAGGVVVDADNLTISGSGFISSTTNPAPGSVNQPGVQSGAGGDVSLNITETLTLNDGGGVVVASVSDGDAGNLHISAGSIVLSDQDVDPDLSDREMTTQLSTTAYSDGQGGDLTIETGDLRLFGTAVIQAGSFSQSNIQVRKAGDGGDLSITADTVSVENGAAINTGTQTAGDAGSLSIRARELTLTGKVNSDITADVLTSTATTSAGDEGGEGGDLLLDVGTLIIGKNAQIGSGTSGAGDAGEIVIQASDRIEISGFIEFSTPAIPRGIYASGLFNSTEFGSSGNGGNVSITTPHLEVREGGIISVNAVGSGDAGSIEIKAGEVIVADRIVNPFDGSASGITALVSSLASGAGGQIEIESDRIHLYNGGQITTSSDGAGAAGSVVIRAGEVLVEGSENAGLDGLMEPSEQALSSTIASRSITSANAGSVSITADTVELRDRGIITVSNTAGGAAGNVNIAAGAIKLDNGSVQAEANAGDRGNLNIDSTHTLLLRNGSRLSANATETATGGNITLSAPLIIGTDNSDISANAVEGDGGNIRLITQGLVGLAFRDQLTPKSDITASSELGVSGSVDIESPNTTADSGLVQLPENLEDASSQVVASCATQEGNQFISSGRGGLPQSSLGLSSSTQTWNDFRSIENLMSANAHNIQSESAIAPQTSSLPQTPSQEIHQPVPPLQEASAWQISATGNVELVAAIAIDEQTDCLSKTTAALSSKQNPIVSASNQ